MTTAKAQLRAAIDPRGQRLGAQGHLEDKLCVPGMETKGESYRLQDAKSRGRRRQPKHDDLAAGEVAAGVTDPAAKAISEPVDETASAE